MPKKLRTHKPVHHITPKPRSLYAVHPWECRHTKDHSEITAYVEASGRWERVLTVHPTSGARAETMATYITALINQQLCKQDLLQDAMDALELVMNDGLNFSSEQAAEHAIDNIKKVIS